MADAAARWQWLGPAVGRPAIVVAQIANGSERKPAHGVHAEPVGHVPRRQDAKETGVGRNPIAQWQNQELEIELCPLGAAALGTSNDADAFARDHTEQVMHAMPALLVPQVDEGCAPKLAAECGA